MIPALSHAWSEILSRALLTAVSYLRWSDALLQQCFGQSSRATMLTHCRTLCRCIRDIGILADTLVIDVAQVCYVTHRLLVCVVFAFVRRIVVFSVIWSLSAVRLLFSPWSCHRYVTHRLVVCVVFAFVRRIVVSAVVWSLSAVGLLFSPCIVIAARVGFLFRILVLSVVV